MKDKENGNEYLSESIHFELDEDKDVIIAVTMNGKLLMSLESPNPDVCKRIFSVERPSLPAHD